MRSIRNSDDNDTATDLLISSHELSGRSVAVHFCLFCRVFMHNSSSMSTMWNIYIFIAIALDESIFLDVLHFPMKNIMSRDLEATPMGEATSKPIQ